MTTLPVPTLVRLVIKRWKITFHSIDEVWDPPSGTTAGIPEQEAPGQEYTDISI